MYKHCRVHLLVMYGHIVEGVIRLILALGGGQAEECPHVQDIALQNKNGRILGGDSGRQAVDVAQRGPAPGSVFQSCPG